MRTKLPLIVLLGCLTFAGCNPLVDEQIKNSKIPISGASPRATGLDITVKEDEATGYAGGLVATDSDSATLTYAIVSQPSKGTVTLNASSGAFTYLPTAEKTGTDSFTFTASDGDNRSNTATVTVTITPYCTSYTQIAAAPFTSDFLPTPDGTAGKEYRICTKAQMDTIAGSTALWKMRFKLYDNIDMSNGGTNNGMIGTTATKFTGVFDGRDKTISNFRFVTGATTNVGVFGFVQGSAAEIKRLTVDNVNISSTGNNVGGLVGNLANGAMIAGCRSTGSVSGGSLVGGLVGFHTGSVISASSSSATVGNAAGSEHGGLVGRITGLVFNSYATGAVTGGTYCGGFGGVGMGMVFQSYSTGSVAAATGPAGAFLGSGNANLNKLTNVFSTGNVSGNMATATIGGLIGDAVGTTISNSYRYTGASCTNAGAGGCNAFGTAEATLANLYSPANAPLSSWNFTSVWTSNAATGNFPTLSPTFFDSTAWGSCAAHATDTPFAGGAGTAENPYLICTPTQLVALMTDDTYWNKGFSFKLMSSVDLSTTAAETRIGTLAIPFEGQFDGNGKPISNFTYSINNDSRVGLFGVIRGVVKRVALVNASVTGSGTTSNVAGIVGGVAGFGSLVTDSYVTGTITGGTGSNIGGVVGGGSSASQTNTYSAATIVSTGQGVGGVSGTFNANNTNFATGDVTGNSATNNIGIGSGLNTTVTYYSNTAVCTNLGAGGCHASGTSAAPATFQFKTNPPLTSWDFDNVWQENAGALPTLR